MAIGRCVFVWRHGTCFRIRTVDVGGYKAYWPPIQCGYELATAPGDAPVAFKPVYRCPYLGYVPQVVSYRISVNGRLIDCAPTEAVARRLCERHGRRLLLEGRRCL